MVGLQGTPRTLVARADGAKASGLVSSRIWAPAGRVCSVKIFTPELSIRTHSHSNTSSCRRLTASWVIREESGPGMESARTPAHGHQQTVKTTPASGHLRCRVSRPCAFDPTLSSVHLCGETRPGQSPRRCCRGEGRVAAFDSGPGHSKPLEAGQVHVGFVLVPGCAHPPPQPTCTSSVLVGT